MDTAYKGNSIAMHLFIGLTLFKDFVVVLEGISQLLVQWLRVKNNNS